LKISYINAIATVCEAAGANVQEVAQGIGLDERSVAASSMPALAWRQLFSEGLERVHQDFRAGRYDFKLLKEVQAHQTRSRWSASSKKIPTRSGF